MQSLGLKLRTVGFDIFRLVSRFGIAIDTNSRLDVSFPYAPYWRCHADSLSSAPLGNFRRYVFHTMHLRSGYDKARNSSV